MVPNPSVRKQENEIHPTKTHKKVTIITKKESKRELEVIRISANDEEELHHEMSALDYTGKHGLYE